MNTNPIRPAKEPAREAERPLRFLVIAASDDDAAPIADELRRSGFVPTWLRIETLEALRAELQRQLRPDIEPWRIVISDWQLPGFDARTAFAAVRESEFDLPFIVVSDTIGEEAAVEAMRAGIRDCLQKSHLARLGQAVERELREADGRVERRSIEEQLVVSDRMASVGTLAAGVAHEINNPLATVLANLELATRETQDLLAAYGEVPKLVDLRDELRDAREAAERVRATVRDLKVFSRADDETRGPIDLRRVMESSVRMAWNEIRHRARLVKDFQPAPAVEGNEARLGQVFLNLIVNAAQAIPEGNADGNQIRLSVWSAQSETQEEPEVIAEVRDTGAGMDKETQARLFSPFFTTKPIGIGTGLGLSICQRIVSTLGGRITVESEVGKGSVFRVHLPPAKAIPTPLSTPRLKQSTPPPARRGQVMAVDDEPTLLFAVKRALQTQHDVTTVTRAREALDRIAKGERFDVILCDLMMPEMTGMDLHAELVRTAPDQALRMIFLTGGTFTPRARQFLDTVPNMRIEKPFEVPALRALVAERIR